MVAGIISLPAGVSVVAWGDGMQYFFEQYIFRKTFTKKFPVQYYV